MNAAAQYIRNASPADLKRIGIGPERRATLKAELEQAQLETVRKINKASKEYVGLLGGLEPRNGGVLRKINPTVPPSNPPIVTVAFADDGFGRRFKITTTVEALP